MRRLRNALLDLYWVLLLRNVCPCRWTRAWPARLCSRLDDARWRYREPGG